MPITKKAGALAFVPIFLIGSIFGLYVNLAVATGQTTTSSLALSNLDDVSLYQYTTPLIQRQTTLPHGDAQYYPSTTYDELHFRLLLPLAVFPTSNSSVTNFYLDGIQVGCEGIDGLPSPENNSLQAEGFGCDLSTLYPIGSVHNLTVIVMKTDGSTFRLERNVVVSFHNVFSPLPDTAETTNATLGIQLLLSLNTTMLKAGQGLNVSVLVLNTLPKENNISGANDWAIPSLPDTTSFPCPNYIYYQVFQGFYSLSNLSSAGMPLQVSPVFDFLSCPIFQRSYYLFQPYSAAAAIPIGFSTKDNSTLFQVTPMSTSGYLTGNYSRQYNASVFSPNGELPPPPFRRGNYTIIAGDEWGQLVLLHFVVGAEENAGATSHCPDENDSLCISYLSLRAGSSQTFAPTLWSAIYVPRTADHVNASIDGIQVYYLSTSQSAGLQDISQQIRNSSLKIVVGQNYSVGFTITYVSGDVGTLSRTVTALPAAASNISATGVSLCSQNCIYPSPLLSALVSVNASVPLSRLQDYVNGSLASDYNYSSPGLIDTQYGIDFKGSAGNQTIISGGLYNITFVGTFEDGTVSTSSSFVRAD